MKHILFIATLSLGSLLHAEINAAVTGQCSGAGKALKTLTQTKRVTSYEQAESLCHSQSLKIRNITKEEQNSCTALCLKIGGYNSKAQKSKKLSAVDLVNEAIASDDPKAYPKKIEEYFYMTKLSRGRSNSELMFTYNFDRELLELKKGETLSSEVKKGITENLKANFIQNSCSSPSFLSYVKKGVIYRYSFYMDNNIKIGEFKIGKEECK